MKSLIFLIFLVTVSLCTSDVQEFEAELPVELQVQSAESSYEYYLNYLKGLFISSEENRSYPLFKQCNGQWADNYIDTKTIWEVGCLMSSVSMALNGLGKSIDGGAINPGTLNAWLKKVGGYSGNLFVWGSCTSPFSLKYLGQFADVSNYVSDKYIVILNVHNGGHWVLATSYSGGVYKVNDPGYQTTQYSSAEVDIGAVYEVL